MAADRWVDAAPPPPFLGVFGIVGSAADCRRLAADAVVNPFRCRPQFASMTPWVLRRPSQVRLPPPLALTRAEYAADYNEIKSMGAFSGSPRSADQSELAL